MEAFIAFAGGIVCGLAILVVIKLLLQWGGF